MCINKLARAKRPWAAGGLNRVALVGLAHAEQARRQTSKVSEGADYYRVRTGDLVARATEPS
jgi:hypothetical protein